MVRAASKWLGIRGIAKEGDDEEQAERTAELELGLLAAGLRAVRATCHGDGPGATTKVAEFQRVLDKEMPFVDLVAKYGDTLPFVLEHYVEATHALLAQVAEPQLFAIPDDPDADDPYTTTEAERHAGWSIAHLVLHVTASAEEGAAFSSLLARGVAAGGRLRYGPDWREVNRRGEVVGRVDECRRICRAYLETWPARPHLEILRILPENLSWMKVNAPAAFLGGLLHWRGHLDQFGA